MVRRDQRQLAKARTDADDAAAPPDRTLWALLAGQFVAMLGAFLAAFLLPRFTLPQRHAAFWAGLGVMIAGSLLRRHCFRMLGASFTADVRARPDQAVVERGAYRWIRHPSYTAGFLMFIGIGLALGNLASLVLLALGIVAVYGYRVAAEERTLLAIIGPPYQSYMGQTRRFIPFLW